MILDWLYEALGVNGNIRDYPGSGSDRYDGTAINFGTLKGKAYLIHVLP